MPNIDPKLLSLAESYGIGYVCTGGGCDYIGFSFHSKGNSIETHGLRWCALVDEHGECPDIWCEDESLRSAEFTVFITVNDSGDEHVELQFSDIRSALAVMSSFNLHNCTKDV